MKYKAFTFNPICENTYILWDESTRQAAIVDAGMYDERDMDVVRSFVEENGLGLSLSLQTHTHFDHVSGLPFLFDTYGLRPMFHPNDERIYNAMPSFAGLAGFSLRHDLPRPEKYLSDGDEVWLGESSIKVIHTPGHTPGGLCLYSESGNLLLSGDTLFCESVGRTDLPGGSLDDIMESIKGRLLSLPQDTIVLSGHGMSTTIGWEAKYNPYLM